MIGLLRAMLPAFCFGVGLLIIGVMWDVTTPQPKPAAREIPIAGTGITPGASKIEPVAGIFVSRGEATSETVSAPVAAPVEALEAKSEPAPDVKTLQETVGALVPPPDEPDRGDNHDTGLELQPLRTPSVAPKVDDFSVTVRAAKRRPVAVAKPAAVVAPPAPAPTPVAAAPKPKPWLMPSPGWRQRLQETAP
jgi:hypothetical protein